MIKAWRREDGRYRLEYDDLAEVREVFAGHLPGNLDDTDASRLRVASVSFPEESLWRLGAEKVYGVVAGPSSCGCEPARFRWATESEVKAGKTTAKLACGDRLAIGRHVHQCDIIDVCGEADVAEQVYEAEFAYKIGGMT